MQGKGKGRQGKGRRGKGEVNEGKAQQKEGHEEALAGKRGGLPKSTSYTTLSDFSLQKMVQVYSVNGWKAIYSA